MNIAQGALMESTPTESFIVVICPKCRAEMHARPEHAGRRVACPDCGNVTIIAESAPAPPKRPEPAPAESSRNTETSEQKLVLVKCFRCGTRMHFPAKHSGKKVRCPDCESVNVIPEYHEEKRAVAIDLVVGEYHVDTEPPKRVYAPAFEPPPVREPVSRALPEAPEKRFAPRTPWFLFRGPVASRVILTTLGFVISGSILSGVLAMMGNHGPSQFSIVGAGGFLIGSFFFGLWALSFAAACAAPIVEETSEGADEISEWPSGDWREWLFPFLIQILVIGYAAGVGWGARTLAGLAGGDANAQLATFFGTVFLCYPVFWLSALESGAPYFPFSAPVLKSLVLLVGHWLLFFLQTGIALAAMLGLAWGLLRWPFALTFVVSPLLAAYLFVYARLLGRLGWTIVDRLGRVNRSAAAE